MHILNNTYEYGAIHNKIELLKTCKRDREWIAGKPFE